MKHLVNLLLALMFGIIMPLYSGLVLSYLWAWFIIPVFPALPALTFIQAGGIMLLVGFLNYGILMVTSIHLSSHDREIAESPFKLAMMSMIFITLCWLIAWFFKALFM